jgi:flagellar assembly factor FliW
MPCVATRFGQVTYEESDVVNLPEGLAPFFGSRRFLLLADEQQWPFVWLQSVDEPELTFVALPLEDWFPSQATQACETFRARYAGHTEPQLVAYGLVVIGRDPMTVNVLAPVVVDFAQMQGRQIVLDGPLEDARRPLVLTPKPVVS